MALIAQAATLAGRIPGDPLLRRLPHLPRSGQDRRRGAGHRACHDRRHAGGAHRARALSPEHPVIRGTAQNPDVFFQIRERANPFYDAFPDIVQTAMDRFALDRPAIPAVRLRGRRRCGTGHRADGLRRRDRRGNRGPPHRPGREGRTAQAAPVPPPGGRCAVWPPCRPASGDCRAGSLQGTRRRRRTAVQGRDDCLGRGRGRWRRPCRASSAGATGWPARSSHRAWWRRYLQS
jgi:hypothetical protein